MKSNNKMNEDQQQQQNKEQHPTSQKPHRSFSQAK